MKYRPYQPLTCQYEFSVVPQTTPGDLLEHGYMWTASTPWKREKLPTRRWGSDYSKA